MDHLTTKHTKSSELIKRIINKYIRNHSSTIFYALIMMIVSSAATGFHAWIVPPALDYVLIKGFWAVWAARP